jgi:hypothetical protein
METGYLDLLRDIHMRASGSRIIDMVLVLKHTMLTISKILRQFNVFGTKTDPLAVTVW